MFRLSLPVRGLLHVANLAVVFFNLMMAICLLSLLPTVILVSLLQKYVVQGLAAGAVKG